MLEKLKNYFINLYLKIIFFLLPRLLIATVKSMENARLEAEKLPMGLVFSMCILQDYKGFAVQVKERGFLKLVKPNIFKKNKFDDAKLEQYDIKVKFKHAKLAFLVLGFIEGTADAFAKGRMVADGELSQTMAFIRILNILEANILPKFMAKKILKSYPKDLTLGKKLKNATKILFHLIRTMLGGK